MADTWAGPRPAPLRNVSENTWRSNGDTVERLELLARLLVGGRRVPEPEWTATGAVLEQVERRLRPALLASGAAEIRSVLRALDGRFVEPGPSGAPTRGRPDVLPTGRNFFSVDSRAVPTAAAWHLGWKSAALLVERYVQEQRRLAAYGRRFPPGARRTCAPAATTLLRRSLSWARARCGTGPRTGSPGSRSCRRACSIVPASTSRSGSPASSGTPSRRRSRCSIAPSRRWRASTSLRICNPIAARIHADERALLAQGVAPDLARRRASFRVFGSKPGAYGAGLQALIDERGWEDDADLARAYVAWGGYAYGGAAEGVAEHRLFEQRLAAVELVLHNQDNREHDILDSDDYYQFEGGITAAVRHLSGAQPEIYHNDHSRPETPRIRTLKEEIGRIVRARAVNPKWLNGVMRHGYKGAFEIAATVDYLFAFAATARVVEDHHFDALYEAYLEDDQVRGFVAEANPAALREIAERFQEAIERGLWRPASNSVA